MRFVPTTTADLPKLAEWIAADPWHKNQPTTFWLGSGTIVAARLEDAHGIVLFLRADDEHDDGRVRLHVQFAPESVVSKRRVAVALLRAVPVFADTVKRPLVTESISPSLIKFLERVGFKSVGGNDYVYEVAEEKAA
jgi:hypothetical protein